MLEYTSSSPPLLAINWLPPPSPYTLFPLHKRGEYEKEGVALMSSPHFIPANDRCRRRRLTQSRLLLWQIVKKNATLRQLEILGKSQKNREEEGLLLFFSIPPLHIRRARLGEVKKRSTTQKIKRGERVRMHAFSQMCRSEQRNRDKLGFFSPFCLSRLRAAEK